MNTLMKILEYIVVVYEYIDEEIYHGVQLIRNIFNETVAKFKDKFLTVHLEQTK